MSYCDIMELNEMIKCRFLPMQNERVDVASGRMALERAPNTTIHKKGNILHMIHQPAISGFRDHQSVIGLNGQLLQGTEWGRINGVFVSVRRTQSPLMPAVKYFFPSAQFLLEYPSTQISAGTILVLLAYIMGDWFRGMLHAKV